MSNPLLFLACALPVAALAASIVTLFWLFQRHIAARPLLAYVSRRPVPWSFLAPAALISISLLGVVIGREDDQASHADVTPENVATTAAGVGGAAVGGLPLVSLAAHVAEVAVRSARTPSADGLTPAQIWGQAASLLLMTVATYFVLSSIAGATSSDLGWPVSWAQAGGDIGVGAVAFFATLAPVLGIQFALVSVLGPTEGHPLLEQLEIEPTVAMIVAAGAAAVVAAPLFEETAFRLVFQGWLERASHQIRNRYRVASAESIARTSRDYADPWVQELPDPLPSWAPILVSGSLFSLAHFGQGVAPISLLPLGLALGYLYQRTHRIIPSMTCHALFNAFSMLALWLAIKAGNAP